MPTLADLDTLKTRINNLGDEPRLLAERGETLADVAPPEVQTDPDLERLLDDDGPAPLADGVDEMEALLGNYADTDTEIDDSDDFNLDDLIDDVALDTPDSDDLDQFLETGLDGVPEEAPEEITEDVFTLDDLQEADTVSPLEPEDTASMAADDDFSLDDLDLGDALEGLDDIEAEDTAEDTAEDVEDFSFDDLSFDESSEADLPPADTDNPEDFDIPEGLETDDDPDIPEIPESTEDSDFSLDDLDLGDMESIDDDIPGPAEESESLDSFDVNASGFSDEGNSEDDFALDNLDFDDSSGGIELDSTGDDVSPETPEEELGGLEDLGDLDDLGDMDEMGDLDSLDDPGNLDTMDDGEISIPDVGAAVEDLGDVDSLDDDVGELSLDDDLNFEEELGADVLSDIREAGDESQQFSMDDFGEQYNFKEGESGFADNLGVDLEQLEQSLDDATEDEKKPFSLEEEDFKDILRTLASLPRNLKIAIEEVLADDRRSPEDIKPLVNGLIDGETPKILAGRFQKITKRKIELPRSYEKRSGRDLETRRSSLTYRLLREGWPVIRTVLLIIAVVWVVAAVAFMWIYRPLHAGKLYKSGLESIAVDEVGQATELFYDAWDGWPLFAAPEGGDRIGDSPVIVKGWKENGQWLSYARTLRRRKHWDAADRFYAGYLNVKPDAKDVRLEYAEFLSSVLGRYEHAVSILDAAPVGSRGSLDRAYMLAAGDVFLRWAEDDPTRYEEARYRYAKVLETSRNDERAILSMMRYHLHIGDDDEIKTLLPIFKTEVPGRSGEPELAGEVFAGLADWHLDRSDSYEARRFLDLALGADPSAPEPHYVDARYWRSLGDGDWTTEELEAVKRTLVALDGQESMSRNELEMRILTLGRLGRIQYDRFGRISDENPQAAAEARSLATGSYSKALDLYEDARDRNQLGASPQYGLLYLELGDVLFNGVSASDDLEFTLAPTTESLTRDSDRYAELVSAETYFNEAEALFDRGSGGSRLPDVSLYRRAYARYVLDLDGALVDFHRVARKRPDDYDAHLALATVLLESGDYEASRSQYARTIELLDEELRQTGGYLNPLEKQGHEELLIRYIVAWNNLGVGRAQSAARGGGDDDYAAALTAFTMASEYFDQVYVDMPGLISRGAPAMRDEDDVRISNDETGYVVLAERGKGIYPYQNRLRLLGLDKAEAGGDAYLMYPDIPSDL